MTKDMEGVGGRTDFAYLYRTLVMKTPTALAIHRGGRVLFHNPSYAGLLEFGRDTDLVGTEFAENVALETDRIVARELIRRGEENDLGDTNSSLLILDRFGKHFPVRLVCVPAELDSGYGVLTFIYDLRENYRAASALRQSEARMHAIIDSTSDLIWSVDFQTRELITCNNAFEVYIREAYGAELEPMNTLDSRLPEKVVEFWDRQYSRVRDEGQFTFEITSGRMDRSLIVTICPIFDGETISAVSVFAKDVTERRNAEKNERAIRERMFEAEKLASLGLLAAGIAHEINNPNQYISGNIQLLSEAWKSALPILDEYGRNNEQFLLGGVAYPELRDQVGYLFSAIEKGSRRIRDIVSELKYFLASDRGVPTNGIDLNTAVRGAIHLSAGKIKSSTSRFSLRLGDGIPPIMAETHKVEQVVINLVQNSCEALERGDQGIIVSTGVNDDGFPYILVEDEGKGMDQAELQHIETAFYTTKRASGGMGLGLFVSANIVKSYGGTLSFESSPGNGTKARVTFPHHQP